MKRNLILWPAVLLAPLAALGQQDEKLFNGKDLSGWEGDPRLWSVVEGVLVGETNGTDKKVAANTFLIWKGGDLGDFDLKLAARVTGDNNSGVQYRSRVIDAATWSVGGYQLDMHPNQEYLAMLYEERGRGIACLRGQKVVLEPGAKPEVTGKLPVPEVDLAQFNEYTISARGNVVKHFVNGKQAAEIVDNDPEKRSLKGILALQLHAGGPMKLEVREIVLRKAPQAGGGAPEKAAEEKTSKVERAVPWWVWSAAGERPDDETIYLRKTFEGAGEEQAAQLVAACDNRFRAFLNGKEVGAGTEWESPEVMEVRKDLVKGRNVIAVEARNAGGVAAFVAALDVKLRDGGELRVVTDDSWKWSAGEARGWKEAGFDDSNWKNVTAIGRIGVAPWGDVLGTGAGGAPGEPQAPQDVTAGFKVAKDFRLEKLYDVPKAQGSWVSMAVRPDGRLIVCDQYGGMYGIVPPALGEAEAVTEVQPLDLAIGGSHGMLWHRGALYVSVNERAKGGRKNGVYKVSDSDGDGELDTIESLKEISGGGEHGLHALVPSPDGEWIYLVCGNHTTPPEMDHYWMPRNWGEDHLLPRNPDGRGHARDTMAPGGWICRFKPDNSRWELVTNGFRNPYDLAFNAHGDLFAYDADMEWDLGMPWYRPTRLCHVVPGAEWGWRNGTGKWPTYYEDSLPPVVETGPGSPTGVLAGLGGKFPRKYQEAIFLLDWTFATIYAIHLDPDGTTYSGLTEEFVAGPGLPLTDAQFGTDGAMYFLTGGRRTASALWRVTYTGRESTAPVGRDSAGSPLPELVDELRAAPMSKVVATMGSEERFERFLARLETERRPVADLRSELGADPGPWQRIGGAIAVARQGGKDDRAAAMGWLGALKWSELSKQQKLGMLRAYALIFARMGAPGEGEWKAVIGQIDAAYPAHDAELDAELCRVLCYLQAPEVVGRTLRLMAAPKDTNWPDWAELASRNSGYGRDVLEMLRNTPPAQDIHYAFCLRTVKGPWTEGQRKQIIHWYSGVQVKSGGKSYGLFLEKMKNDMIENATVEERSMISEWKLPQPASPFEGLPTPTGPGRSWTIPEVVRIGSGDLSDTDAENGRDMYKATLCAACHRIKGEGGSAGPDLSAVGGRFTVPDLAEALLDPHKVVSDQYQFDLISLKDGSSLWGRVMNEEDGVLQVAISPFDFTLTQEVARAEVQKIEPSPVSPMPAGLINSLNEEELRNLLGYLLQK